ncbi:hypothetical protein CMI47_14860 [Candidatus Pacearchaeota archaeon]|nr:hypothetical protein [Candidatus Pacearchaeota archaeon]|tara:strand:+ start:2890 stop:3120 length:231 start_codon:yes stop_codon:yes gene_type:complete
MKEIYSKIKPNKLLHIIHKVDEFYTIEDGRDTFEFEDKFKVSWKISDKLRVYNLGEVSKLQGKQFYKGKIGMEYKF